MKRFAIREVETLKTTAADYGCWCWIGGELVYVCGTPIAAPPV